MDKKPTPGFHPYGQLLEATFPESHRDIVPITWKDGTTTYNYRGKEYTTEEEAITARDGPAWGKKAVEFAGKTLMSSPTISTIANKAGPIVGKVLGNKTVQDALTMPGEDTVVPLIGDSFVQYGLPRIAGEGLGYGLYPGPENPSNFDNIGKIFDATRKGNSLIEAGTGTVIRTNDGVINNNVFAISPHMDKKVKLHERALNDEALHWDKKAVARRSKIDEQFQLDSSGKPEGPHKVRGSSTETERRAKAAWSLGEEVTPADIKIFEESNQSILDGYNWHLHGSDIKIGRTDGHHKGVVRQIFDASNGLNKKYRIKSAKYMEKRIGFELGYHGRNVEPIPTRFHPRVHAIINSRISSSPDRFNVEGIAQKLGFPKNWQSVLTYKERLPLYNEVADAIRESVDAINTSWKVLLSRSDDLTTYSKEEYLDLMLQHKKLDDKLRQIASPSFMAQTKKTGWDLKDTSTTVLNEILDKSNRSDLRLPYIGKVEPNMAPEIRKLINQENGWQLMKEVLLTNKSAATVMKAYPKVKLTTKQQNSLNNYARTLRSRGKSLKFIDELGMRSDD